MPVAQQLTVIAPSAPRRFAQEADIEQCKTYRDAVHMAWECRANPHLSQRTLADTTGIYAPHLSQILHSEPVDRKGKARMNLQASDIDAFERAVGNHIVRQFLMKQAQLRIAEMYFG